MSWFEKLYNRKPGEVGEAYPMLNIEVGKPVTVTFLEDHPRVVATKFGDRGVINVMVGDTPYSLWLSRMGLANAIALLEAQVESLKGKSATIVNKGQTGRMFRYDAAWVSKAPEAKKLREKVVAESGN
jgi:hypothetical protein